MKKRWLYLFLAGLLALTQAMVMAQDEEEECDLEADTRTYSRNFDMDGCRFQTRFFSFQAGNPYWIMEPGWQVVLEGEDEDEFIRVEITVLDETETVAGVETRVIEEAEYIDGEIYEVSRNFYAICGATNDIYYFGEDVDFYEDGEIVDHHGAWRAGENGAQPGIIMPGTVLEGARFYQEYAFDDEAVDRAEVMGFTEVEIDEEVYENVLMLKEGSELNEDPCDFEIKLYAPGIGNIVDGDLELVEAGFIFELKPAWPFKQEQ